MKILFVEADTEVELNSSIWLCRIPANALATAGHAAWLTPRQAFAAGQADEVCTEADIIIVERWVGGKTGRKLRYWAKRKPVIIRFDDAYHLMPESSATSAKWGQPTLGRFHRTLGLAAGFSTPSSLLTEDFAFCNPRHWTIPNRPDLTAPYMWERPHSRHRPLPIVTIGWGGTHAHIEGWKESGLIPALVELEKKYPIQLFIVEAVPFIRNEIPMQRAYYRSWRTFELWPWELAKFDIFVIPLAGPYDMRRSWIKALEASLCRVPWVASDMPPYENCEGGIKVPNETERWYSALASLIEDSCLRENLALEGYGWATRQDINCHVEEYNRMFREVL